MVVSSVGTLLYRSGMEEGPLGASRSSRYADPKSRIRSRGMPWLLLRTAASLWSLGSWCSYYRRQRAAFQRGLRTTAHGKTN